MEAFCLIRVRSAGQKTTDREIEGERCMTCALKPLSTLQRDIAGESYEDLKRMVYGIVLNFHKRTGIDMDTLLSEANYLFLQAHARHKEERGALSTCVYHAVYRGLRNIHRREKRRLHGMREQNLSSMVEEKETHIENLLQSVRDTTEDLSILMSEMGEDCRNVVHLILFQPYDFYEEIDEYENARDWKSFLEDYLHFQWKWEKKRIRKTMTELKKILSE